MDQEIDDTLSRVGPRLRALRSAGGLTLQRLSELSGISASTLSRLESGQRRPALEQLLPLARVHGVPLDDLVGAPDTGDPRIHIRPIRRRGMTILPLSRGSGGGGLQVFKHVIAAAPAGAAGAASATGAAGAMQTHEGHEWLYVIRGNLRLRLGARDLVLPAGEAAEFDTRTPHWFGRADANAVEFLSLFGPQGERVHVRPA